MCFQRTIQDLFEVEAGSGEKVEEFVVLHQEPSSSEAISPRIARPYIQALHSINLDSQEDKHLQQKEEEKAEEEEITGSELAEGDEETPGQDKEEPAYKEELNTVMKQVDLVCLHSVWKLVAFASVAVTQQTFNRPY